MDPTLDTKEEQALEDRLVDRVVNLVGNNQPVKRIRKSQVLTALMGAIGFALFSSGVADVFGDFPAWSLLILGFVLMVLTGLLLQNLNR